MTELEKIERAKMYIDKLANGINPLNDMMLPDDDIVNNVRISRCFFFLSGVLNKLIEEDKNPKRRRKNGTLPFSITLEERNQFEFSEKPITISDIAKRLNQVVKNEDIKRIKYSQITSWLIEIGMLTEIERLDGKRTKYPTPTGNSIGISTEERIGERGNYTVTIYNKEAQSFILDNIEAIMDLSNNQSAQ